MNRIIMIWYLLALFIFNSCNNNSNESKDQNNSTALNQPEDVLDKYSNSPKLSIKELIELHKLNYDDFEEHLLKKGYKFDKCEKFDITDNYLFAYPQIENSIYNAMYSKFIEGFQSEKGVQWSFYDEKEYLAMKEECKDLGFTFWNTSKAYTGVATSYKKNDLAIMFLMETIDDKTLFVVNLRDIK